MSKESESKPELKSGPELEQGFKNSLKNPEELSFMLEESISDIKNQSESDLILELESIGRNLLLEMNKETYAC